jgi:hypothetical protein
MTTDATQVTGSPQVGGPRPGDVLAERYELLEALDREGPSIGFRALDQETERPVLVRVLARPGLHTDTCDRVVEQLRGMVGVGGRFLSSLLDADREGRCPFTVEAFPAGTQLSAIFDARRERGEALGARELLPVVARLSAALAALPEPWSHGDVRAERVWLDADGLRLTGPYLLVALPSDELAERVGGLGPGVVAYPPEVPEGRISAASDRWGVAAIAWEALTGRAPDPDAAPAELPPALRAALRALLAARPDARPKDLSGLLDALAARAGLAVPQLDPEPHRPPTARVGVPRQPRPRAIEGAADDGTREVSFDQILEERPVARKIAGAAPEGTQEISFDQIIEEGSPGPSPDDTAKHAPVIDAPELAPATAPEPDSLDPRLVRAALGVDLESDDGEPAVAEPSQDSLDPRLVRAALGVEMDGEELEEELDELPSEELEALETDDGAVPTGAARASSSPPRAAGAASRGRPAPKPSPRPGAAPAPRPIPAPSASLGAASAPRGAPKQAAAPAPRPASKPASKPASTPASTPAPRPAAGSPPGPQPASTPAPRPAGSPPGPRPASTPAPRPAGSPSGPRPASAPAPRPAAGGPPEPRPASTPGPRPAAGGPPGPRPASTPAPRPASAPAPRPAAGGPPGPRPASTPASTPAPRPASTPAPRPAAGGPPGPGAASPSTPEPSSEQRASTPTPTPREASPAPSPAESPQKPFRRPAGADRGGTALVPRESATPRPTSRQQRSKAGLLIVVGALILAILIVGAGFLIAAHRRSEAVQRRQIEERLQQLRRPEGAR